MLEQNLRNVKAKIAAACERANRNPEDVLLVAVSKTKPLSDVEELIKCNQQDFGENKVQELVDKYENVSTSVNWHLILRHSK